MSDIPTGCSCNQSRPVFLRLQGRVRKRKTATGCHPKSGATGTVDRSFSVLVQSGPGLFPVLRTGP